MKKHYLKYINEHNELVMAIPASVLYRQGKYIVAISEMDGMLFTLIVDKRRYNREHRKAFNNGSKMDLSKYDKG